MNLPLANIDSMERVIFPINEAFEEHMAEGVRLHAEHDQDAASAARSSALEVAEHDLDRARAWRDIAATLGYQQRLEDARSTVEMSLTCANSATAEGVNSMTVSSLGDRLASGYESGATLDRRGRVLARLAIQTELSGGESTAKSYTAAQAQTSFITAEYRIKDAEKDQGKHAHFGDRMPWPFSIHQYRINMDSHAAMSRALGGSSLRAIGAAVKAIPRALLSENPLMQHSVQEKMGLAWRVKQPAKHLIAAGAVIGVSVGLGVSRRPSRRRRFFLKQADRIMH